MRCIYCHEAAGFARRTCPVCASVIAVVGESGGQVGPAELVDIFAARGLSREQVDRVLDAEVGGQPTLRDRMTSEMVNGMMRNLGMPGRQSPEDVLRVRRGMCSEGNAGTWVTGEKPPKLQ